MVSVFSVSPVLPLILLFCFIIGIIAGKILKFSSKKIILLSVIIFFSILVVYCLIFEIFLNQTIGHF